jgi:hypothetical protein
VADSPRDFSIEQEVTIVDVPARHFWNAELMRKNLPSVIVSDDRPGAPKDNFFWAGDHGQAGWVLHGYRSAWLPASLLKSDQQQRLVEALFASSRHWSVSLHFNKGLAGAPPEAVAAARDTATNPAVLSAFALAIIAGGGPPVYPGIPGHEPDLVCDGASIPRADNSCDYFVLHHVLEHFGCGEGHALIDEACRVLKPGGSLLVFVPDLRMLADRWLSGQMDTQLYMTNVYGAYMGNEADRHKWGYDRGSLAQFLSVRPWTMMDFFDWREIPGADISRDWWICGMECVK